MDKLSVLPDLAIVLSEMEQTKDVEGSFNSTDFLF